MNNIKLLTLTSFLLSSLLLTAKEHVHGCEASPQGTYTLSIQELVPIKCNGGTGTLRANITVTSGTVTGIAYSWSGGGNTRDVVKATGTYTVTVTSTNSSSKTATFTLIQPTELEMGFASGEKHPCVNGNGSFQVRSEGGTKPYKLQLLNASNLNIVQEKINITTLFTTFNAPAGTYKIKVIDANLCTVLDNSTKTLINSTKQFTNAGIILTPTTCFQSMDGILQSTPEQILPGINSTFYFELYDANRQRHLRNTNGETTTMEDLNAGTYLLEIFMVECNCPFLSKTIVITQPSQLTNQGTINNVDCFNNASGKIINTTTGGNGGYTYAWSNGTSSKDLNNVKAGTYSLTVSDAKNCETNPKVQSFTITQPTQLSNTSTITNAECFAGTTGKILNMTTGGNGGYKYIWNTGATSKDLLNIKAGTYTLTTTDSKNCETNPKVQSIIVTEPKIVEPKGIITDVDCFNNSTGKINLNPVGGNGGYKYAWSTGATTQNISGLKIGTFKVSVTDSKNCKTDPVAYEYIINQPDKIENTGFLTKDILCFGQRNGEITQAIQGGISPYSYLWNDGNQLADRDKLLKGNYSCKITDKNNCVSNFAYTINEPKALIQIAETIVPQGPQKKGAIFIVTSGGKGQYFYDWTGPNGFKASSEDIFDLSQGEYTLSVQDENGCINEKKYTVPFSTATHDIEFKDVYYLQYPDRILFKNVKFNQDYNLQLIKSDGSLISNTQLNSLNGEIVMDTKSISPGIYIIQLNNTKHSYNVKVIIY
ncbi:MAG: hypothetical protein LKG19_14085 [Saprospiraceae bacterium]|jgi:hypothetical protein|nr:hypothetical protein [Saprospiraceae bacterium]